MQTLAGASSIVLAPAWEHGEQSIYPPVIGQILQVGHIFYRIIHFISSIVFEAPWKVNQRLPFRGARGHELQQMPCQPGPFDITQDKPQLSLSWSEADHFKLFC